MKKIILLIFGFFYISSANAYIWSSAVPIEVHMVPEGLVLLGEFSNTGVTCATGPQGIFLPNSDPNFDRKVSMALTAFATQKKIKVLINDPLATNCEQISAMGNIPIASHYYWQLK